MYKVLWLMKRKPGISHEQFRDHYENSHAVLGQKYFGHLITEYKRNYKAEAWGGVQPPEQGERTFGPVEWEFDCVTEWTMPSEEAFNEILRLVGDPVIGKVFYDDEENFLDRNALTLIKCDCRDTGPGDGAETLRLRS